MNHMQNILSPRNSQPEATPETRVPVTFHVSRFTPRIHRAVLHPGKSTPPNNHLTLSNTDGFWELTLGAHHAVLVQDQALFYVAFLLAHPGQSFLPLGLAEKVYELYGAHPDFRQNLPALDSQLVQARHAEVLRQKVKQLEAILD